MTAVVLKVSCYNLVVTVRSLLLQFVTELPVFDIIELVRIGKRKLETESFPPGSREQTPPTCNSYER